MNVWRVAIDPTSGRPYYYSQQTRETRWDMPPGFIAPPTPAVQFGPAPTPPTNSIDSAEIQRLLQAKFNIGAVLEDALKKMISELSDYNIANFEGVYAQLIDIKKQLEAQGYWEGPSAMQARQLANEVIAKQSNVSTMSTPQGTNTNGGNGGSSDGTMAGNGSGNEFGGFIEGMKDLTLDEKEMGDEMADL